MGCYVSTFPKAPTWTPLFGRLLPTIAADIQKLVQDSFTSPASRNKRHSSLAAMQPQQRPDKMRRINHIPRPKCARIF